MWFEPSGLFCTVSIPAGTIDVAAMQMTFDFIKTHAKGEKVCWLGDITEVSGVNREARDFAAKETPQLVKALAVITRSGFSKVLAELFLLVYKPPFPIMLFTDAASAREWLLPFMENRNG